MDILTETFAEGRSGSGEVSGSAHRFEDFVWYHCYGSNCNLQVKGQKVIPMYSFWGPVLYYRPIKNGRNSEF